MPCQRIRLPGSDEKIDPGNMDVDILEDLCVYLNENHYLKLPKRFI
jgi:hypothetical protein